MDKNGLTRSSRFWGAQGLSWGCSHVLAGAGGLASVVARSHSWHIGADCLQEASFPIYSGLSTGCLNFLMKWHLTSPTGRGPREQGGRCKTWWCDLASDITLQHTLGGPTDSPGSIREGLHRGMDLRSEDGWRAFWMMALRQQLPWRSEVSFSTPWFWSGLETCFDQ